MRWGIVGALIILFVIGVNAFLGTNMQGLMDNNHNSGQNTKTQHHEFELDVGDKVLLKYNVLPMENKTLWVGKVVMSEPCTITVFNKNGFFYVSNNSEVTLAIAERNGNTIYNFGVVVANCSGEVSMRVLKPWLLRPYYEMKTPNKIMVEDAVLNVFVKIEDFKLINNKPYALVRVKSGSFHREHYRFYRESIDVSINGMVFGLKRKAWTCLFCPKWKIYYDDYEYMNLNKLDKFLSGTN